MGSGSDGIKERLRESHDASPLLFDMTVAMLSLFVLYLLVGVLTFGGSIYDSLFPDKADIFMDYFNSIFFSWTGKPYSEYYVLYPPLITVFYGILAIFISNETGITDGFGIRDTYVGPFSYMIFVIMGMYLIHLVMMRIMKEERQQYLVEVLIFLIMMSYPVIFAIMRGNSILYAVIFASLFILGYRSQNTYVRYGSYLCLGIATGIKIFPAVLWLLTLREKNLRESAISFVIVVLLLFVPFIFTDGTPISFISAAFSDTSGVGSISNLCNTRDVIYFFTLFGVPDKPLMLISTAVIIGQYVIVGLIMLLCKDVKHWEAVALCVLSICLGFGTSASYMPIYLIISIPFFLSEERKVSIFSAMVAVFMIGSITVFPGFMDGIGRDCIINIHTISMILLFYMLIWNTIMRNRRKNHQPVDETSNDTGASD